MSYKHGVFVSEVPTAITPPSSTATIPVVFGTAAVNRSLRDQAPVNEPILCYTYAEAVAAFGYSDDWSFTLSEFIYSHFALFAMSPVVLINVLDPATHKATIAPQTVPVTDGIATLKTQGVLKNSVIVKSSDGTTTYNLDDDYTVDYDKDGNILVQVVASGTANAATQLQVSGTRLDPSTVDADDIIGGIVAGKPTGLELLNQVFPRFRQVPSLVLAPGYSHLPTVAAVMTAKAGNINSSFKALALTDLPANQSYTEAVAWKNDNNYTSNRQVNGYPKVKLGDKTYHMSTQLAGVLCATDAANGGIPFVSPSNKSLQATASILDDGIPLFLGQDQAQYLNGEGIVTALNFVGGWKAWGNRTGAYPASTDPKDSFIPVRRMMDWIANTVILTYWQYLDDPISRRMIQAVTDSVNVWLNGLVAQGALLGGRIEFIESENPTTSLMDGIISFHMYVTPPSPAREIDFTIEYDPQYLSGLFS
ncbi:MAG: phage tail sheath family protein [Candidatus Pristimantibacillus sp.]